MTDINKPITIQTASLSDLPEILKIYEESVLNGTASFELEPPGLQEITRRYNDLVDQNFPYYTAKDAGNIVLGYAYAGPYRTRPAYRFTVENSIYVRSDARGLGIGDMLLKALIRQTTDMGFRQMIAVIGDSDHQSSIGLHSKNGFQHIGAFRSIGWKMDQWLDTVLMQRPLGEGAEKPPSS